MQTQEKQAELRLGFLTAVEIPDRGFMGGLLVTNRLGRPLEFQCTNPVKPNRTQEILYGPTLVPYLLCELLGPTLVEKVGVKPHLIFTEKPDLLDLRNHIGIPVVLIDPRLVSDEAPRVEAEDVTVAAAEESLEQQLVETAAAVVEVQLAIVPLESPPLIVIDPVKTTCDCPLSEACSARTDQPSFGVQPPVFGELASTELVEVSRAVASETELASESPVVLAMNAALETPVASEIAASPEACATPELSVVPELTAVSEPPAVIEATEPVAAAEVAAVPELIALAVPVVAAEPPAALVQSAVPATLAVPDPVPVRSNNLPNEMRLGRQFLRFHAAHSDDRGMVERNASSLPHDVDLREPFERVREALAEAVRASAPR